MRQGSNEGYIKNLIEYQNKNKNKTFNEK